MTRSFFTVLWIFIYSLNASIVVKSIDKLAVPESNKLQIMLQSNGRPVGFATKGEVMHAYANGKEINIGSLKSSLVHPVQQSVMKDSRNNTLERSKASLGSRFSLFSRQGQGINDSRGLKSQTSKYVATGQNRPSNVINKLTRTVRLNKNPILNNDSGFLPQYHRANPVVRSMKSNASFSRLNTVVSQKIDKNQKGYVPMSTFHDSYQNNQIHKSQQAGSIQSKDESASKYLQNNYVHKKETDTDPDNTSIKEIYTDLETALSLSNNEAPIRMNPNIVNRILRKLNTLNIDEQSNDVMTPPDDTTVDHATVVQNLTQQIAELENKKVELQDQLVKLKTVGSSVEDIQAVESQEQYVVAEEEKLLIAANSQADVEVKIEIEQLNDQLYKLAQTGASDEEKAEIQKEIGELEIEEIQLEEQAKELKVDAIDVAIEKLENEEQILDSNNASSDELVAIQADINQLSTQKQSIIEDNHIIEDVNQDINDNIESTQELSAFEGHDMQVEELKNINEELLVELEEVKAEDAKLLNGQEVSVLDPEQLEIIVSKIESANSDVANINETGHKDSHSAISLVSNPTNHEALPALILAIESYKANMISIYSSLPASKSNVPESTKENLYALVKIYQSIPTFIKTFDNNRPNLEGERQQIYSHVTKADLHQGNALEYYGIATKYDEIKVKAKYTNMNFIIKNNEISVQKEMIVEKFSELLKLVNSLRVYEQYINDNLNESRYVLSNKSTMSIEQENDFAYRTARKLLEIKADIVNIAVQTTGCLNELKAKENRLNDLLQDLERIGNNSFYYLASKPSSVNLNAPDEKNSEENDIWGSSSSRILLVAKSVLTLLVLTSL